MNLKDTQKLMKEIRHWNDIEKQIDKCPKEDYNEFTRLEKLWIYCPIDELMERKLQMLKDSKDVFEELENLSRYRITDKKYNDVIHWLHIKEITNKLKEVIKCLEKRK